MDPAGKHNNQYKDIVKGLHNNEYKDIVKGLYFHHNYLVKNLTTDLFIVQIVICVKYP